MHDSVRTPGSNPSLLTKHWCACVSGILRFLSARHLQKSQDVAKMQRSVDVLPRGQHANYRAAAGLEEHSINDMVLIIRRNETDQSRLNQHIFFGNNFMCGEQAIPFLQQDCPSVLDRLVCCPPQGKHPKPHGRMTCCSDVPTMCRSYTETA